MQKAEAGLEELNALTITTPNLQLLADGTYDGSFETFPVKVRTQTTIKDHQIIDVRLLEHRNGKGQSAEELLPKIVETQSLELDVVAGATYSSIIILKSVELSLTP